MSPSRRFTSSADSRRKKRRRNVNFSPKISTSAKQQRTHTKNFGFDDIREGSQKSIASSRSHEKHPSTVSVKSLERRSSIFSTKSRERCTSNGTTSAGNASDVSPITTTKDALAAGKNVIIVFCFWTQVYKSTVRDFLNDASRIVLF